MLIRDVVEKDDVQQAQVVKLYYAHSEEQKAAETQAACEVRLVLGGFTHGNVERSKFPNRVILPSLKQCSC